MKKFVILYYSPQGAIEKMKTSTPQEMAAGQKEWMDWFAAVDGSLVEMGEFFGSGKEVTAEGTSDCTGKVTGYSILQADSMGDIESMLATHPHTKWFEGCSIEAYEPMDMGH